MNENDKSSTPNEWKGSCFCGAVAFRIALPVSACVHCHCSLCQRLHGAGHVAWIALPNEALTIEKGAGELVEFRSSDHGLRSFCGKCGSQLFCRIDSRAEEVDIPLANLDPGSGIDPQAHIFFDDRASWTNINDELPKLSGETGLEPIDS